RHLEHHALVEFAVRFAGPDRQAVLVGLLDQALGDPQGWRFVGGPHPRSQEKHRRQNEESRPQHSSLLSEGVERLRPQKRILLGTGKMRMAILADIWSVSEPFPIGQFIRAVTASTVPQGHYAFLSSFNLPHCFFAFPGENGGVPS